MPCPCFLAELSKAVWAQDVRELLRPLQNTGPICSLLSSSLFIGSIPQHVCPLLVRPDLCLGAYHRHCFHLFVRITRLHPIPIFGPTSILIFRQLSLVSCFVWLIGREHETLDIDPRSLRQSSIRHSKIICLQLISVRRSLDFLFLLGRLFIKNRRLHFAWLSASSLHTHHTHHAGIKDVWHTFLQIWRILIALLKVIIRCCACLGNSGDYACRCVQLPDLLLGF